MSACVAVSVYKKYTPTAEKKKHIHEVYERRKRLEAIG